jgi:hypothetical protein
VGELSRRPKIKAAYWLSKTLLGRNKKNFWIAHQHELLENGWKGFMW